MIVLSSILLFARLGAAPSPAAEPATAIAVVAADDSDSRKLFNYLEKDLEGQARLRLVTFSEEELGDPIYKGKVVAALERASVVVALGEDATQLVFDEVEETPVYFVASMVPGKELSDERVSGELSYSPEDILSAMPQRWKSSVGLLYTPGYEPLVAQIRALAKDAGIQLRERRVSRAGELPGAARSLMDSARALWVLGDPILSRGAGFEFLVEQSLSQSVPLIGSGRWDVSHGAALCSRGRDDFLAQRASHGIAGLLASRPPSPRVGFAEPGGNILFNRNLEGRFGLTPQPKWQALP